MSEWRKMKLGELYEVHNGLSKGRQFFGSGYPFLTFSNVFNNWFLPDRLDSLVQSSEKERNSCSIKRGDVFITRTSETMDELGMSSVALKDYPNATYNGFTKRLRPITDEILPEYIGYYLRSRKFRAKFMAFSSMTTRASLANDDLLSMEIEVPELDVQRRVAKVLSRYDSLIENYQRQIKLLEEAAQRLYKEWFVDLRFPGHESTPIIDGIPQGWGKGILNDIALESGKKVDKKYRDDYECYLPIDCIPKHSLTYINPSDVSLAESSLVSFQENDIIFGAMRPYFHKVCFAQSTGLTRTTCFVLNSRNRIFREYLLMLLFDEATIKHATSISVGTTMPYTRWKEFKSMAVLIPDNDIINKFGKRISLIINELKSLSIQIRNLSEARDRLLPKLMSAEIEVLQKSYL